MKRPSRAVVLLLVPAVASAVMLLSRSRGGTAGGAFSDASSWNRVVAARALEHMPLSFIENRGQLDSRVAFYVQGRDTALYFTAEGMTLSLTEQKQVEVAKGELERVSLGQNRRMPQARSRRVVKLDFVGANPNPEILAGDSMPGVVSYFKGRPEQWKAGLKTYASITYADLWPGIDLVYSGTADRLKYSFLIKPGADPGRVRLAYRGARAVKVNGAGQLEIETPAGVLQDDRPYAYQEIEGRRVAVDASYALDRASGRASHGYGFAVHSYDRARPLVLDPAMLVYAGYIGGSGDDEAYGIAVDSSGNTYVTGSTSSTQATFPVTVGPDVTYNGTTDTDAFVAKVNAAGTALIYCGYIGGSGNDAANGIAVDSSGNAYVTGRTASTETTFPVTVGPDVTYNGGGDAFVAKVNAAGTALVYCGYIGGDDDDLAYGIAVDSSGNAYIAGATASTQLTFPVAVGPDVTYNGGLYDAFVAKVNAAGTGLVYCGYIGGSENDEALGIAVDSSGNAYVTGDTTSSEVAGFPVTGGPDLSFNGPPGDSDAFVAKVNAAGTGLVYCGYIGGSSSDIGWGIAVDSSGNAYIAGVTSSAQDTFPVAVGPDVTYNSGGDAFVAKVNASGTALVYCGYIGGSGSDEGHGIAVDGSGNAYVTGFTSSTQDTFPVAVGPDVTYNGGTDAFVAEVNAPGTALLYCGYIGGINADKGYGIAVDSSGNAYVTGFTASDQTSFPVLVGPDLTYNGPPYDAFVAKVQSSSMVTPTSTPTNTPTNTPTPTRTPTNTPTRTPTNTPTGVFTNTPTNTPTRTPTNTPVPQTSTPTNTPTRTPTNTPTNTPAAGIKGDFNGDGKTDIVFRHSLTGADAVWLMNGTVFSSSVSLPSVDPSWSLVGTADFNGDGKTDLLWQHSSGVLGIWLMDGTTFLSSVGLPSVDPSWRVVGTGDFNGDGQADIVFRHSSGLNGVWFMNGTSYQSAAGLPGADPSWSCAGVGDFNGDGKTDLLWRHSSGANGIWFMNGTAIVSTASVPGADPVWVIGAIGDYNGDGKPDIVWRHSTQGLDGIWLMNGAAISSTASLPAVGDTGWKIVGPK